MHSEIVIWWIWRCSWRPCSCELGGHNREISEIHFEGTIELVRRCPWRHWSSELPDAHRGCDWPSKEMHLQAVIEQDWKSTWRWSILQVVDLAGGRSCSWSIMQVVDVAGVRLCGLSILQVVHPEAVNGRRAGCWDCIHRIVKTQLWECDEVTVPLQLLWRTGWCWSTCVGRHTGSWSYIEGSTCNRESEGMTDSARCLLCWVYCELGVCYNSVLTHDHGMERSRAMT